MSYVVLKVLNGASIGQRLQLRPGQTARIGSTEWADFCVRDDARLAEIHFSLALEPAGCVIRDLSGRGLLVNQRPTTEAQLRHGDRVVAGETQFHITLSSEVSAAPLEPAPTASTAAPATNPTAGTNAVKIAERCELDPAARALLQPEQSIDDYLALLVTQQRWLDAVKFLAQALPKRQAIRWGAEMLRLTAPPTAVEIEILAQLEAWWQEPDDTRRRATMALAERNDFQCPAAWLAAAAFWSEGSMLAPELPEVLADVGLTGRTVGTALVAAAWQAEPRQPEQLWRLYLQHGRALPRNDATLATSA